MSKRTSSRTPKPTSKKLIDRSLFADLEDEFELSEHKQKKQNVAQQTGNKRSSRALKQKRNQQNKHGGQSKKIKTEVSDSIEEICLSDKIEDAIELPATIVDDAVPMQRVLSLEAWKEKLTRQERQRLCQLIPHNNTQEGIDRIVKDLFEGENFHFGNPAERCWREILNGDFHPTVAKVRLIRKELLKRNSFLALRKRHDEVVDNVTAMRKFWMNLDEDVSLKERVKTYEEHVFKQVNKKAILDAQRRKVAEAMKNRKKGVKTAETPSETE